jgi:hypothetical protein
MAPAADRREVKARVVALTFLGADTLLEATFQDAHIRARVRGALSGVTAGDEVSLSWALASEWILKS